MGWAAATLLAMDTSALRARLTQMRTAFVQTRAADPLFLRLLLGIPALVVVLTVAGGLLLGPLGLWLAAGLPLALLAALLVFGQRVQRAALTSIEGQAGAAAAVLQSMRGWRVHPAVAMTRKQEFVHLAVGRPGVVLVGEGGGARVAALLKQERRKVARVAGETPVHDVHVGEGEGQVSLRRLQNHLTRLPRAIKTAEVATLERRLSSLGSQSPPVPRGPMPRAPKKMR